MNPISLFPVVTYNEGFNLDFDFEHVDPFVNDYDADAPISQWELVNPSDADESYDPSDYGDHEVTDGSVVAVMFAPLVEDSFYGNSPPLINQYISSEANLNPSAEDKITDSLIAGTDGDGYDEYRNERDYDHEDDDEEEYDDGLDDELVPRHMRGKLGRERIRKLGKRGCSKMNTSKKSPFLFVKSGCLHGKHGFGIGLKNSL